MLSIKHTFICSFISFIALLSPVVGDLHSFGPAPYHERLYNEEIFASNSSTNTNYTVKFKFLSPQMYGVLSYSELDVNCKSTGYIYFVTKVGPLEMNVVDGEVKIIDGKNCTVMADVEGYGGAIGGMMLVGRAYGAKLFRPKAFILGYAHNSPNINQRVISFGKRQTLDTLLHEEEAVVKIEDKNKFAEREFEYYNSSSSITYVEFIAKSPTILVHRAFSLSNRSKFQANIYDLIRLSTNVRISVYGYYGNAPDDYVSLSFF